MLVVIVIDIIFIVCLVLLLNVVRKEKKILKTWKKTDALIVNRDINQINFVRGRNVYRVKADLLYLDDQLNTVRFDAVVYGPLSYENLAVGEILEIRYNPMNVKEVEVLLVKKDALKDYYVFIGVLSGFLMIQVLVILMISLGSR